jgi:hypothetical protein
MRRRAATEFGLLPGARFYLRQISAQMMFLKTDPAADDKGNILKKSADDRVAEKVMFYVGAS